MSILDKILAWSDPELIVLGVSLAMKGQITLSKDRNVRARPFEIELAWDHMSQLMWLEAAWKAEKPFQRKFLIRNGT